MATILLADDHPLTMFGTKSYVEHLGHQVVECCTNGISAYNLINVFNPDIAILDVSMPGLTGLEILEKVYRERKHTRVILLTMHKEYSLFKKALEFKLGGYLIKDTAPSELQACIDDALQGKCYISTSFDQALVVDEHVVQEDSLQKLTPTEKKIIELIVQQKTSKQIADIFFVSVKQIEKYRTNIIQKLALPKEKNALLMWAMQHIKIKP